MKYIFQLHVQAHKLQAIHFFPKLSRKKCRVFCQRSEDIKNVLDKCILDRWVEVDRGGGSCPQQI